MRKTLTIGIIVAFFVIFAAGCGNSHTPVNPTESADNTESREPHGAGSGEIGDMVGAWLNAEGEILTFNADGTANNGAGAAFYWYVEDDVMWAWFADVTRDEGDTMEIEWVDENTVTLTSSISSETFTRQ